MGQPGSQPETERGIQNRKRERYSFLLRTDFLGLILTRDAKLRKDALQLAFKCLDKIVNFSSHELSPRKLCRQTGKTARDEISEIFANEEMSSPVASDNLVR